MDVANKFRAFAANVVIVLIVYAVQPAKNCTASAANGVIVHDQIAHVKIVAAKDIVTAVSAATILEQSAYAVRVATVFQIRKGNAVVANVANVIRTVIAAYNAIIFVRIVCVVNIAKHSVTRTVNVCVVHYANECVRCAIVVMIIVVMIIAAKKVAGVIAASYVKTYVIIVAVQKI